MRVMALIVAVWISGLAGAFAQTPVKVIGAITPGDCAQFNSATIVKDAGFSCAGAPGNAITALTGDGTATGPGSVPLTLATVNSNVGSFGSVTQCVAITVNAKGLITAASAATCTPAVGSITGLGTGVATALAIAVNGNGGIVSCTPNRAGDIIYWNGSAWTCLAGNNTGSQFLSENSSGLPSWSTPAAQSIPGGFLNVLRGNSMTAFFHGTSGTATTTAANTNWTAEGVFVLPTGASVTWAQQSTSNCPTGNQTFNCVKVTGAASVTDVKIRFVLESYTAAKLAGQTVTFQILWKNNSGSSITPTLATNFPTSQDGGVTSGAAWGGTTADLAATNMQACTNGSTCTEAYTLAVSSSATAGYEFVVDFGNNFGNVANSLTLGGGFDARVTPGVSTGTNASPPPPEIRDPEADIRWNQRFFAASYNNGVAAATATRIGLVGGATGVSVQGGISVQYPVTMRAAPSILTWGGDGTSGHATSSAAGTYTDAQSTTTTVISAAIGTTSFQYFVGSNTTSGLAQLIQYTADASIWGG